MAGIIHKIEEKLGMGGNKEGEKKHDEHKPESHGYVDHKKPEHGESHGYGEHKKPEHGYGEPEHKEGLVEKIKDKIHGGDSAGAAHDGEKKKKKKEKKKHGDEGYKKGDSSSSDSD